PDAVTATREIAERCAFTLDDLGYELPEPQFLHAESLDGELWHRTMIGARDRYGGPASPRWPKALAQLERELSLIAKLGLAGYFLIVHDLVRFCKENRILAQGRGSAANSAVCYALRITAVDPVGMGLLFERFLSEERTDSTGHARLVGRYLQLCQQIAGRPRHLGQHSGGMIIARGRLDEIVPIEPASMPGRAVVQWDKDDCADLGIIKIDLLGLGMMAVLEQAIPLVQAHEGVALDLAQLPPGDPGVYRLLQ